jgi:hypothetical protein
MLNSIIRKNQAHPRANKGQMKCQQTKEISANSKKYALFLLVLIIFYFDIKEC